MSTRLIRALMIALCLSFMSVSAAQADTLDINTATADQIASVMTGVGPAKAEAIVAYRDSNGPFSSIDQLVNVRGIGVATVDKNRDLIRVSSETTE